MSQREKKNIRRPPTGYYNFGIEFYLQLDEHSYEVSNSNFAGYDDLFWLHLLRTWRSGELLGLRALGPGSR
jgi:hypothetical protein